MHGPLHEIGLLDILQLLERGRQSGELLVFGPDSTKPQKLRIRLGKVISVEPGADDQTLRRALLSRSLVAEDGCGPPRWRVEQLRQQLAYLCLEQMVRWQSGEFDFNESEQVPGPLELSAEWLSRNLVARELDREELDCRLDGFGLIPDFPGQTDDRILPPLDSLAWRVLDAVDGLRSVQAIAERLDEPIEDVAHRIELLLAETILVRRSTAAAVDLTARAALAAGRHEEAIDQLRCRIASVADDGEAWRLLGLAQVCAGRFDQAVAAWTSWQSLAGPRAAEADLLIDAARTMLEAMRDHRD